MTNDARPIDRAAKCFDNSLEWRAIRDAKGIVEPPPAFNEPVEYRGVRQQVDMPIGAMPLKITITIICCLVAASLHVPGTARAQAGPPFLTNDPGTPGNANWEINLASMQSIAHGVSSYQVPQIDLNYGLGERFQLTYEIPYVLQDRSGQPMQSGWSNGYPGVKWRFLDQGEDGWHLSTFPQVEIAGPPHARQVEIAAPAPRYLVPLEVAKKIGVFHVDFEAGYYFRGRGPKERILGLVAGRPVTERLELDAEFYDDRPYEATPYSTTLDVGGRFKLQPGVIALFMAGRSINGLSEGQPEFFGYFGVQILLSNYGRMLSSEP
ncbi:MAG: hypothetical protein WA807_14955 [Steroidobacteraceae bacterium]